jgi:hypothetical protein
VNAPESEEESPEVAFVTFAYLALWAVFSLTLSGLLAAGAFWLWSRA